ncbi:MAG: Ldh family oxidoreductase [Clostridia bacterium]|nr:Ldh family oxidoreductase [Clostridia bacterium]
MIIKTDLLHSIIEEILRKNGASSINASIVADEIIFAQIRGKKSHGIPMLPSMVKRVQKTDEGILVIKESNQFAFIDGCNGIGPVVAKKAMDISINKTLEYGFSLVAVKNPSPFITAGYPVWYAAKHHKLIAFDTSVAKSKVAPYGSSEAVFGTNPIGFAFPTDDYPIVIDMSTTNIAAARIKQAAEQGIEIPNNVAINNNGEFTTDPNEALKGALVTFGGYKGSAISLIVELMAGAFLDEKCGNANGDIRTMLFFTIDPNLCANANKVLDNATNLRNEINSSTHISGFIPRTPGDRAQRLMQDALANGIELSEVEKAIMNKYGANL